MPRDPEHLRAIRESQRPVNLTAVNNSYEVPDWAKNKTRSEEERKYDVLDSTAPYRFFRPDVVQAVTEAVEKREAELRLDRYSQYLIDLTRQQHNEWQQNNGDKRPFANWNDQYWVADSPEEIVRKDEAFLREYLRQTAP